MKQFGCGATVLLVLTLMAVGTDGGFLDWFRSDKNKGHNVCKVDFEVLDPKGLRLWTAQKPNMKMFGVELYINPVDRKHLVCSVCKNTSEPLHGKFFINQDDVIVKSGDILEYVVITDNGKTVQRHKARKLFVDDYLIKPKGRCNCPAPLPAVTNASKMIGSPTAEIELLERILTRISGKCAEGIMSSYLFLQVTSLNGLSDQKAYVVDYFNKKPALKPFVGSIGTAEDSSDGIVFQVANVIDKLKILEISRQDGDILDYDKFTAIEDFDIRANF